MNLIVWSRCPSEMIIWGKVFKNGPSKICGRQPLKNLNWLGTQRAFAEKVTPDIDGFTDEPVTSNILKAAFHKSYSVHSWILWPILW